MDRFIDDKLGMGRAPKTVTGNVDGVKQWLSVNGVKVDWGEIEMPRQEAVEEDRAPTREELKKIFGYLNIRNKAVGAMGISSGLRLGTILSLTWGEVDLDSYDDLGRILVKKAPGRKITGRGINFFVTWMTPEAKVVLLDWKNYSGKIGGKTGPEDKIFPMKDGVFNNSWILALEKAGLAQKKRRIRELHLHTLRKFFRTQCENAGVKRSYWDFWMGHKGGYLDPSYFRAAEEEHVKEYREAVPYLMVETQL